MESRSRSSDTWDKTLQTPPAADSAADSPPRRGGSSRWARHPGRALLQRNITSVVCAAINAIFSGAKGLRAWAYVGLLALAAVPIVLVGWRAHVFEFAPTSDFGLRGFVVSAPLSPSMGASAPCPAVFPSSVRCNSVKRVPASDADMPLIRAPMRWEAVGLPPGGCCAWSDAYKFIFIRTPKAASTTVLSAFLRPAVCPVAPGETGVTAPHDTAGHSFTFSANCTADLFTPLDSDCAPCADIPRWKWLHYFVFTTVRNPFVRAVSSYAFCVRNKTRTPFAEFCVNPDVATGCAWTQGATDNPPGTPDTPNVHWSLQTLGICGRSGCIVDWVARVEHLVTDLSTAVASINELRRAGLPALPPYWANPTRANRGKSEVDPILVYAQPGNAHCEAAVAAWYAPDFELLGYPRTLPVPQNN